MSTQKQRELWYCYVLNQRGRLENEIKIRKDNIRWSDTRKIDAVDLLELALAQERLNAFNEFVHASEHIFSLHSAADLLDLYRDQHKND